MNVIERFMQLLLEQEDESNLTPIVQHGDVAFIYIKHTNVYRKQNCRVKGCVINGFGF